MTTITLSSRGQIVIPAIIREKLNMEAGDQLTIEYDEESKELTLRRVETIDEMATRFTSWIKPGTPPLMDTRAFYRTREPRM